MSTVPAQSGVTNQATLSVMMANYNHARFIPEALDAILAQSLRPLEIVIIDDGSTDDSVAILEQYEARHPALIRLIRNESNLGLLPNLHRLTGMARGEYMVVPAFDDRVLPGFFERSVALLEQHPQAALCSCLSLIQDEDGRPQGLVKMPRVLKRDGFLGPADALGAYRRHGNWFMGNTVVFRRAAMLEAGGYRAELGAYCDGFLSLVLAARHGVCFIPEALAVWRRMPGTFSQVSSKSTLNAVRIFEHAEHLMRTDFRELFSSSFIAEWRREMLYGLACAAEADPGRLMKFYLFMRYRRSLLWTTLTRRLEYSWLSLRS